MEKLDVVAQDGVDYASSEVYDECFWEEELKVLISGGVLMELKGEVSFIKFSRFVW